MLDVLQTERRYFVFDKKTFSHFIDACRGLTTYTLDRPEFSNITDIYMDTPKRILEQNELLLRKRVIGNKALLRIKRLHPNPQLMYSDTLRAHEREREINPRDRLSKHFLFLNNALNSMFTTTLKFDPDKLFEQVQVIMIMKMKQTRYLLFGYGGLKVEITNQIMNVQNNITRRKNNTEMIQIRLLSNESTLQLFNDFITRIEKHCKEIFYTKDSRYDIGQRITKPLPTKEERRQAKIAALKRKAMEESGEIVPD